MHPGWESTWGQRQRDRSRAVESEARVVKIIAHPLPPHLEKHGCLGSKPDCHLLAV